MDDPTEIIKNFEEILNQNAKKEPIALYRDLKSENLLSFRGKSSHSVQDVISKVSTQIKAIQKADVVNTVRHHRKKLDKFKKSTFLSVNMLLKDVEVPIKLPATKFETQLVSDTQLIDIIENAEALVDNNGITQEFDNTFSQTDIEKMNSINKEYIVSKDYENNRSSVMNKHTEPNYTNITTSDVPISGNKSSDLATRTVAIETTSNLDINTNCDANNDRIQNNVQLNDNCTEMLNECIEIETNLNVLDTEEIEDVEIQSSLVFETKKSKTPSPLVFDLETFEDFEKIAVPIIEENSDLRSAKQLINSQIIGKELFIQTNIPCEVSETKEQLSPVLKISAERLKITKTEHTNIDLNDYKSKEHIPVEVKESDGTFLKDEILFSSDEEIEYLHKEFHDIPLTCALETSFYEQIDVLDKTMYVGFQTASNRSIQISKESFCKAKSIFDDVQKDVSPKITLTDLVENLASKHNTAKVSQSDLNPKTPGIILKLEETGNGGLLQKEIDHLKRPDKRKFEGFVTASRKKIKLSDMALARCKKVFQDIDLDDNYDLNPEIKCSKSNDLQKNIDVVSRSDNSDENEDTKLDMNPQLDDDILQEFANDMSLINDENHELKTPSNEDVQIIDADRAMSEKFFDGIDFSDSILEHAAKDDISKKKSSSHTNDNINECIFLESKSNSNLEFIGFKTASNNQIKISLKALEKAENLFYDIQNCREDNEVSTFNIADIKNNKESALEIEDFNQPSTSKDLGGFKTANNKSILVSNEAIARSKSILQDIISNVCKENPVNTFTNKTQLLGFKTANNKEIKISEDAYLKTKDLFKHIKEENDFKTIEEIGTRQPDNDLEQAKDFDDDFNEVFNTEILEIENKNVSDIEIVPTMLKNSNIDVIKTSRSDSLSMESKSFESTCKTLPITNIAATSNEINSNLQGTDLNIVSFMGFQTASKKPINISNEALVKSKDIFKDIDSDSNTTIPIKNNAKETKDIAQFKAFHTGNDKPLAISAKALASSKEIFEDIDDISNNSFDGKQSSEIETFEGFKTANNKPINISTEALAQSKALFKDIDNEAETNKLQNENVPTFVAFQTASKKPVEISAAALAKSKALFKGIDDEEHNIVEDNNPKNKDNIPTFKGFQTASKKAVKISAEALAKSKALFKDIDKGLDTLEEWNHENIKSGFKLGFQTASKKPVKISEEALLKSKLIFKDIDNVDIIKEVSPNKANNSPKFIGFQTASKKPVQVSEKALAKSKALFKDINQEDFDQKDSVTSKDNEPKFKGFQTASKKPVQVSEEALAKSKALFKDINQESFDQKDSVTSEDDVPKFKGFQTAGKKPVQVSEEALAKIKMGFKDIDTTDNKINQFKSLDTTNIKKLNTSEQAIKNLRQIIQDINLKDDCKENLEDADDDIKQQFKTGHKNKIEVSSNAFKDPRKLLTDPLYPKNVTDKTKADATVLKEENNIEKLIDTQVLNNFEQTLYSEDFSKESPKQSKRSGSPILSCPRAKRRKFNTPYRNDGKIPINEAKIIQKHDDIIFNDDYKKTKRYTLKDLAKVEETDKKINPDAYILNFSIDNLLDFKFSGLRNEITDGIFSIEDLKEYFHRVVNKKLIPNGWLDIQLKLILWKLISYEVKFTRTLNRVCTVKNVVEQLKYRHQKELYNVERPVLRKILEKDDVPSKTMVLCVADVFVDGVKTSSATNISSNVELLLTDGWYFLKAVIDKMLTKLVYDEKIKIGSKIMTNGAELMNCEQGVAPWEDTSSVRLKIFGNSTRRARWDARLGCHGNAAILTQLSSVKPEGGKVSKLRLYVTRVYPMLYVEKFEDGSTVTRSERLENIHQIKYEADRQNAMEKLYEEVEKELSDQESQDSTVSQLKNRKHSESMITDSETKSLEEKSNRNQEKLLQNIQERVRKKIEEQGLNVGRNVVSLLKIRVAGVEEGENGVVITKGFMSIWKPNDMLTEIIKENSWIEVMNVVPTAVRYSEIHLSAGRQSVFNRSNIKEKETITPHLKTLVRKYYPVGDLAQNPIMTTDYNEIDTVGFIFQIDEESSKQPFQNIYLSDGGRNIICVNFWGGLRKFGFQNILDTGQIVSCTNLQKRAGNTRKSIPQFRVTEFTYFTKTPKSLIAKNMIMEVEKTVSCLDKKKYCEECIKLKNNYSKCFTENVSPYRFNDPNLTKNKVFIDSPLIAKREDNLNLTGLDFESTFRQTDTQDLSPKSKERKKKVSEKIARLKMIGEPPALSPINIINRSKNAFNSYKSPLAQTIVASEKKSNENSRNDDQSSPIIQMNKTYVKNVNPVKLNFSNAEENTLDEVDHFAEEFDGSPPLSLE